MSQSELQEAASDFKGDSRMSLSNDNAMGASSKYLKEHRKRRLLPTRGLETDRFSIRVPADFDAAHTAAETHGHDHWKVKLLHFVHSKPVQYTLSAMLLADVIILFVELFLQASFPNCQIIVRDAISCCPLPETITTTLSGLVDDGSGGNSTDMYPEDDHNHYFRFLAETTGDSHSSGTHGDGHQDICQLPAVESHHYEAGCDGHKWYMVHTIEEVLFVFTITILSIFFIELIIIMIVLQKAFFKQLFYVLDFVIVSVSLALEIALAVLHADILATLAGLLILARVWRFVRIGHGLIELTAEFQAQDKEALLHYAEELEEKLLENKIALPEKSKQVKSIVKRLTSHGDGGAEHNNSHEQQEEAKPGESAL
ncbi:expressed unknown protein [Seminavis robusta]|uniref:Voltage-gated hydrogen channel 1 n=1 Tax=Seminavis robusta TaxID=568900 RepID=A0A9N8DPM9_9STRA|nr:expressed unknown protein [Seminavis robusta]|eukprot:Sro200_g084890.1 n/a (370) ;mRNA; f:79122-80231